VSKIKTGFVALLALLLVAIPASASAKFTPKVKPTAALSIATDTLAPPTGLAFTCVNRGGEINLTWTTSSDTSYATGYTITGTYSGASQSLPVTPATAHTYTPAGYDVPQGTVITMTTDYFKTIGSKTTAWSSVQSVSLTINKNCP
jgi:hypothetical protein